MLSKSWMWEVWPGWNHTNLTGSYERLHLQTGTLGTKVNVQNSEAHSIQERLCLYMKVGLVQVSWLVKCLLGGVPMHFQLRDKQKLTTDFTISPDLPLTSTNAPVPKRIHHDRLRLTYIFFKCQVAHIHRVAAFPSQVLDFRWCDHLYTEKPW